MLLDSNRNIYSLGSDARLKSYAISAFKSRYLANWRLASIGVVEEPPAVASSSTTPETGPRPTKRLRVGLADLMGRDASAAASLAARVANSPRTEADRYIKEVSHISDLGFDLLAWWRDTAPKHYPNVARMARQFLGCPATSAVVERLFSKAGRA